MVMKTALITLVSTLLIAILALRSQETGAGAGSTWAGAPTANARGGGAMSVTGASGSWSGGGQRGNWGGNWGGAYGGRGSMPITGASGSYSGGGQRGNWGGEHDDDDHEGGYGGWNGDDD